MTPLSIADYWSSHPVRFSFRNRRSADDHFLKARRSQSFRYQCRIFFDPYLRMNPVLPSALATVAPAFDLAAYVAHKWRVADRISLAGLRICDAGVKRPWRAGGASRRHFRYFTGAFPENSYSTVNFAGRPTARRAAALPKSHRHPSGGRQMRAISPMARLSFFRSLAKVDRP